jgi:hypothetical protein
MRYTAGQCCNQTAGASTICLHKACRNPNLANSRRAKRYNSDVFTPNNRKQRRDSVLSILFGLAILGFAVAPVPFAAAGLGEFSRASAISGVSGTFTIDSCEPSRGRRGAACTGVFVADEAARTPVQTSVAGGPHPRGTRIEIRYDGSASVVGPGAAAAGFALASIAAAVVLLMVAGGLRFIIDRDKLYLSIARVLLLISAALGVSGVAAAIVAVILP